jgi:fructokinase
LAGSQYLYIEGYLAASPTGRKAASVARQTARAAGVKIALTLSDVNMIRFCREGLDELWGEGVDLLFSNEEEAKLMFGATDLAQVIEPLQQRTHAWVITRGKDGALVWDGDRVIEVAAAPVKPLDTNGAGDMFAGAVLSCLTRGLGLATAAKLGTLAAGELIQHFGPRLPTDVTQRVHRDFMGRLVYS